MGPPKPRRKPRAKGGPAPSGKERPASSPHPAYDFLIDTCDVREGWTAWLGYDPQRGRFTLTIKDGKKVIAQGDSRARAPKCFVELATAVRNTLEQDERLTG